jgi:hypothetical protein
MAGTEIVQRRETNKKIRKGMSSPHNTRVGMVREGKKKRKQAIQIFSPEFLQL